MATLGRAARIVALLLGFYLLCVVLLVGMVVLDVFAFKLMFGATNAGWHAPKLAFVLLAATATTTGALTRFASSARLTVAAMAASRPAAAYQRREPEEKTRVPPK